MTRNGIVAEHRPSGAVRSAATHGYALDTTWRTLLADLGVRPADVLRRAGLADDLLQRPDARLGSGDYHRLWTAIEEAVGDPPLPIRLCEAVRAESFSPPLFAALCSPNLLVAAERIGRYKRLIAPLQLDVSRAGDVVMVELTWLNAQSEPPPASLVVMELLFCVQLARIGTREPVRPVEVMTSAAVPTGAYEDFLGVRPTTGDAHRVSFRSADALRPFLTSNEAIWAAFEPELRRRLGDLDASAKTAARVRAALLEGLPSGRGTLEATAAKLMLSPRTLQRRIEAEGTSFQALLRDTREALARHYLETTHLPVAEVSFLLGFNEPNSFGRAFRTWTGATPQALRQEARPQPVPAERIIGRA